MSKENYVTDEEIEECLEQSRRIYYKTKKMIDDWKEANKELCEEENNENK